MLTQVVEVFPVAHGEAGEVGGAQCRRLEHAGAHDGESADVGLELHEEVVGHGAAVGSELAGPDVEVVLHGREDVAHLIGDAFEGGPGEVGGRRASGEPDDGSAGVLVPMGRAEAGEGGDEIDAAVVVDREGQSLGGGRVGDESEAVAEPLDGRAADEDASLEGVGHAVAELPGDGREEVVGGGDGRFARVEDHEASCPISRLEHAALHAELSEEGGLLVAGHARDGDTAAQRRR